MADLKADFEAASQAAKQLNKKPDNQVLLLLYALYKQATIGDASGKRPGFTDPVGQAKFDAWKKVQGMGQEAAMQQYVNLVNRLKA